MTDVWEIASTKLGMAIRDERLESIINAALALPSTQQIRFLEEACTDTTLRAEARSTLLALIERTKESQTVDSAKEAPYRRPPHDRVGQTFSSYRVIRQLGSGGMGEVYLALDARLGRNVALKFVPRNRDTDERTMRRFIQEARTASALNHPNILTVYEVGENDGERYLATEYVDGATLRTQIRERGVTLGEAVEIAMQAASALVASHQAGIIHRDLKPTNIMLRRDGYVKVIDFGLAKLTGAARDSSSFPDGEPPTTPGSLLGTVGYMSPEQARGEEVDARTDLWSLGVILYEMITGHRPFQGETDSHVMVAIMEQPTPGVPQAPPALERILQRALQKDRNRRYQNASEMYADLREMRQELDISVSSQRFAELQSRRKERVSWKLLAGFAAALLIPLVALLVFGPSLFPSAESFQIGSARQVTFVGNVQQAVISPNGDLLATVTGEPGMDESVQMRSLSGQADEERTLMPAAPVNVRGLTFAPDNQSLFVVTKGGGRDIGKLYRVPLGFRGPPVEVLQDVDGPVSFSPDGRRFAYIRLAEQENSYRFELAVSETAQPNSTVVVSTKQGDEQFGIRAAWSGRGDSIACVLYRTGPGGLQEATIDLIPVTIGKKERLVPLKGWEAIGQLAWLNSGHDLLAVMNAHGETFNQARLRSIFVESGKTEPLTGSGLLDGEPGFRSVSLSANHQKLATVRLANNARVWVSNPGVFDQGDFAAADAMPSGDVAWSDDGRVVFSASRQGHRDLWLLDPMTREMHAITNSPYTDKSPVWVPGKNSVVFSSNRSGAYGIWRHDLNTGRDQQLTAGDYDDEPTVSPDGANVVYTKWVGAYPELWQVPADGGTIERLNVGRARSARFSPGGRTLLCSVSDDTPAGNWRTAIVSMPEGRVIQVLPSIPAGQHAEWMPGGHEVAFLRTQANVSNVVAYSLDKGTMKDITHFHDGQIDAMDWLPRSGRLALIRANRSADAFVLMRKPSN